VNLQAFGQQHVTYWTSLGYLVHCRRVYTSCECTR
jgi:hypothetical protein